MTNVTALSQYLFEDLYEHCLSFSSPGFERLHHELRRAHLPEGTLGRSTDQGLDGDETRRSGTVGDRPDSNGDREFEPGAIPLSPSLFSGQCQTGRPPLPGDVFGDGFTELSPAEVACRSLYRSLAKKFRDEITVSAEDAAYDKFIRINDRCADWELKLQFSWEEELFGTLKKELDDFFHPNGEPLISSYHEIFDRGRTGPGASLGANGVDFYTKLFSSDLTATSLEVYYQYAAWCAADPNWRDAEFTRLTTFGLPNIVHESSVTFVPKNRDTLRTICTESNLNMFAQLGIGAILEERLRSFYGIDFSYQQDRNAEFARLGSIDGAIDTIDLESASDSLSLKMLETILPDWVFETLLMYRSLATRVRGERVPLNMISTMGNGYTFPLQTIVFACCVRAVAKQADVRLPRADLSWSCWGVFGDDIVLPCFLTARLVRLLDILGFTVNREKSYTDKYMAFRESCGRDYFQGHNVRGVYLKTLQTPQSRYVAINLLNEWSARWSIPLRRSIGYLRDSVRVLAIPPWVGVDAGIRVPLEALSTGYLMVYRSNRWRYSYLFRCYEAVVPSLRVLDDSIAIPRNLNRVPRRFYNPSGLLIAAIGGYLKGGRIPLALKQGENPVYRTRTGVTPFWGPTVEQVQTHGSGFWERWNAAVLDNLGF